MNQFNNSIYSIDKLINIVDEIISRLDKQFINYLNNQNKKINNLIAQGTSIINNMDKLSDISIQSVALFLLLEK